MYTHFFFVLRIDVQLCTYISVQGRSVKFSYEMCKEAVMKEII